MYLPVDVQFELNKRYGLDWNKDQVQLEDKIDALTDNLTIEARFMKEVIKIVKNDMDYNE